MNNNQQTVISLWPNSAPGSENWTHQERELVSPESGLRVVHNVVQPTLTTFFPDRALANGTAVIVCPGGGFHYLEVEKEGTQIARWLNAHGIAAFVLKYRLVPTGDDFMAEMHAAFADHSLMLARLKPLRPMIAADSQQAVRLVRSRAAEWGLRSDRIGIMGFSAGGSVTITAALLHDAGSRPDFAAPIYPGPGPEAPVPADAPPLFIACAHDDGLAPVSARLYMDWLSAGHSAEMHIYSRGGHGFALRPLGLPVDTWIDRFGEWLALQSDVRLLAEV